MEFQGQEGPLFEGYKMNNGKPSLEAPGLLRAFSNNLTWARGTDKISVGIRVMVRHHPDINMSIIHI